MRGGQAWRGGRPRDSETPAGCGAGKGRRRQPPPIDAAVSPQQFGEMAAICTVAATYVKLIRPTYRFHHQPRRLAWTLVFHSTRFQPPQLCLRFSFVTLSAEGLSRMNGEPNADENREGGIKAERGTGTQISGVAIGDDEERERLRESERASAAWTRRHESWRAASQGARWCSL